MCPRALLYLACLFAPAFAQMFGQTVGLQVHGEAWPSRDAFANAAVGRVVLYADEVRPGNALRPDEGRLYLGVYWGVMEFPEWFRNSPNGWLPLCYVRSTALEQLEAGLSELMVSLLGVFFPPPRAGIIWRARACAYPCARKSHWLSCTSVLSSDVSWPTRMH